MLNTIRFCSEAAGNSEKSQQSIDNNLMNGINMQNGLQYLPYSSQMLPSCTGIEHRMLTCCKNRKKSPYFSPWPKLTFVMKVLAHRKNDSIPMQEIKCNCQLKTMFQMLQSTMKRVPIFNYIKQNAHC